MTSIEIAILFTLYRLKRVEGTDELARLVNTDPKTAKRYACTFADLGLIKITQHENPGRGQKTIYEDNGTISKYVDWGMRSSSAQMDLATAAGGKA
jgi:predicted transcriptional regulator